MATKRKRLTISLLPEWEEELDKLKKEKFYNKTLNDLIRYLIGLGLEKLRQN